MPRVLGRSYGGGRFLMGEVPLYAAEAACCSWWSTDACGEEKADWVPSLFTEPIQRGP